MDVALNREDLRTILQATVTLCEMSDRMPSKQFLTETFELLKEVYCEQVKVEESKEVN